MNLGIITKPNTKGQIVIPKKFRDKLGIDEDALLNIILRGNGIFITPLEADLAKSDNRDITLKILRGTAGTWANENWEENDRLEKEREKIEIEATKQRRKAW